MAIFNGKKDFVLVSTKDGNSLVNLKKRVSIVETAEEMESVLSNATNDSVGSYYQYIGVTTANYKKGATYRIGKNNSNQIVFEEIFEQGSGGSVEVDTTLTQVGKAADANAVGVRLKALEDFDQIVYEEQHDHNTRIGNLEDTVENVRLQANQNDRDIETLIDRVDGIENSGVGDGSGVKKIYFTNNGYITFDGVVDNSALASGTAHTDIIPIDVLANGEEGYCVQDFNDYAYYPKVLFFAGKTLDTLVSSLDRNGIGNKDTLKAEEIRALAPSNATHVAFNSEYAEESDKEDFVYVYKFASPDYVETAIAQNFSATLKNYATKEFVTNAIGNAGSIGGGVNDVDIVVAWEEGGILTYFTLPQVILGEYGINVGLNIEVVRSLPNTIVTSQLFEGGTIYLYVVQSTGIVYVDIGYGTMTLGAAVFQSAGFDKGFADGIMNITEAGIFCIQSTPQKSTVIDVITDVAAGTRSFLQGDIDKMKANFANTILRDMWVVNGIVSGTFVYHPCIGTDKQYAYTCSYVDKSTDVKHMDTAYFDKNESGIWSLTVKKNTFD